MFPPRDAVRPGQQNGNKVGSVRKKVAYSVTHLPCFYVCLQPQKSWVESRTPQLLLSIPVPSALILIPGPRLCVYEERERVFAPSEKTLCSGMYKSLNDLALEPSVSLPMGIKAGRGYR